jgi:hypothetical protein
MSVNGQIEDHGGHHHFFFLQVVSFTCILEQLTLDLNTLSGNKKLEYMYYVAKCTVHGASLHWGHTMWRCILVDIPCCYVVFFLFFFWSR